MVANTNIRWSSFALIATGLLASGPLRTLAQTSSAVCLSSFNWMSNSKGQNPCLVAAYLQGACNSGQFTVDPLAPNTHYVGPYANEQNQCQCSSVTYNAISACGTCQNRTIIGWTTWDFNCSTIYPGIFLPAVPDGTAIPAWMFQDVTTSDVFNATVAQLTGDTPEATPTHAQSTGSLPPSSTNVAPPPLSSAGAPSQTPSSGKSTSSNTGAIAGGVVGGVVGLALIVGAIFFLVRRRKRSQMPPSAQYAASSASPNYPLTGYPDSFSPPSVMTQPKLYDPSDPSTFPTTPPPPTVMTGSSGNYQSPSITYSTQPMRPGGYSGVPEV